MNVNVKHNRTNLFEGRNYQMGFAFLKGDGEEFETVQPISPCKDYLNDVIYSEALDVAVSAFGLTYKKKKIFNKNGGYLAIRIEKPRSGQPYANFDKDVERLATGYNNIKIILNWLEDRLGVPHTEITKANDNIFVLTVPKYWTESTYLISLYALLVRMSQFYDGKQTPVEFLNGFKEPMDMSLWHIAKIKLILLLNGVQIKQKFSKSTGGAIHNMGISYYNEFELI